MSMRETGMRNHFLFRPPTSACCPYESMEKVWFGFPRPCAQPCASSRFTYRGGSKPSWRARRTASVRRLTPSFR